MTRILVYEGRNVSSRDILALLLVPQLVYGITLPTYTKNQLLRIWQKTKLIEHCLYVLTDAYWIV